MDMQKSRNQEIEKIASKHTEKKLIICEECNKVFSTKGNLKNHVMTIHKNIRPFKCPYQNCTKEYSNKSRLDVHVRTHTGVKPFVCPICQKSFNEKGNLKTHVGFHSSNRPFECEHCHKTYKTKGHLKDHILVQHVKVRKHKCQICNSEFGRYSTLLSHSRTHKKPELEDVYSEATTRPCSYTTLVRSNVNEEEKKFWEENVENDDLLSLVFGEQNTRNHSTAFDINFDQTNSDNNLNNNSFGEDMFF